MLGILIFQSDNVAQLRLAFCWRTRLLLFHFPHLGIRLHQVQIRLHLHEPETVGGQGEPPCVENLTNPPTKFVVPPHDPRGGFKKMPFSKGVLRKCHVARPHEKISVGSPGGEHHGCNTKQSVNPTGIQCKSVIYCSKNCQKSHWRQHKQICVAIKTLQSENPKGE